MNTALRTLTVLAVCALILPGCAGGATSGSPMPVASTKPSSGASPTPGPGVSASPAPAASASPASGTAADNVPFAPMADSDAFYAQPVPFPNVPHGTILASRKIVYAADNIATTVPAWQLKFVSRDMAGHPIAAVESLVLPQTPASPLPLLMHAMPEDSLGPQCAPSHFTTGSTVDSNNGNNNGIPTYGLNNGWAVAFPDHEGPYGLYAVGPQEGYIILDGAIAATTFQDAGLKSTTRIGMDGYSGGAQAVEWASAMQNGYAPSLNIVGTASGGTPTNMASIFTGIDGTSASEMTANTEFFDIIFMGAIGINRGFPTFISPVLNAAGVAAATKMQNGCLGNNSDGSTGPSGHFSDYTTVSALTQNPGFVQSAAADSMPQSGLLPKSKYFFYHSATDELIPVAGVDNVYSTWCGEGASVAYFRAPAGTHDSTDGAYDNFIEAYFAALFGGTTPTYPPNTMTCNL